MSESNRIALKLPTGERSTQGQIDADTGAHVEDPTLTAARWFSAALDASDETIDLGIDAAHVSRMRKGEKSIPLRHLVELLGNREAVLAFVEPLLKSIGFAAMPKPKLSKRRARELVTNAVKQSADIFALMRERAAREGGVDTEEIELALEHGEEVTKF